VTDYTAEISAVMAQAMDQEDQRRTLAGQAPGYGAAVRLPDNPVGVSTGKAGLLDAVGEGHSVLAPESPAQVTADHGVLVYGRRPQYADSLIGGPGYQPTGIETALRSLGERVFSAQAAPGRAGVVVVSPTPARRSLWSWWGRLFGRR
jgi:hypothetical protein